MMCFCQGMQKLNCLLAFFYYLLTVKEFNILFSHKVSKTMQKARTAVPHCKSELLNKLCY
jgi:hypothetical protein